MKLLLPLLYAMLAVATSAAESNLVLHDDFEGATTQSPPPGWTMWGASQYKVPANYTRDTTNPHNGSACFRIHHPAKTAGYILLAPERALQPRPGKIYTASFWARADKAGKAMISWTAYQSIKPFVDAGSPGSVKLDVGPEWKEFTFAVREGLDFFANQSRYLLLTFNAATESKEERTLWIDNVRVVEQPDPHPVQLVNDTTIAHDTLQHRLQPGEQLEFTVDPNKRLRRATRDAGGVSFHRVCGWTGQPYNKKGEYTLVPQLETAIRDMRLPMTRIYAVGDEPFSIESSIDKVADICRQAGVAQDHCVLEFENQGAATKLTPETWARGVRHSLQKGYAFHYWEIANEPYSSMWGHGGAFPTPDGFVEHFKSVSRAIRKTDPKAQIGVDIHSHNVRWGNYLLKQLAGDYDFVAPHYYCGANVHKLPFEEIALTENYRMLDRALRINALLRVYNPRREVYQYDTEWGMICGTPDGKQGDYEDRNANIIGTLHRAVRLIYYAREDILRGASSWQMFSRLGGQGFGILSQDAPDQRFMLYWLYYYFNRHVGEWALAADGTAPYYQPRQKTDQEQFTGPLTPALVTLSNDGRTMFLVIANGSWSRAVPCTVHLQNFAAAQATGIVLTNDNLDGKPLLARKSDAVSDFAVTLIDNKAACVIPPHAVVFVTLARQ